MANIIIIGSGPAGISAALYTKRAGIDTTIITKGSGSLLKAESIENYYGFAEPVTGEELEKAGIEGAKKLGVEFVEEEVVGLNFDGKLVVETALNTYSADGVILATGSARLAPNISGLKELEGRGVSYCAVCDAFFYRGKDVCVLGSGEYALHEINALMSVAASVTLLTNGETVSVELPESVKVVEDKIKAIEGAERIEKIVFEDGKTQKADGVFVAYGVAGSAALARKIGAEVDGNIIKVDAALATTIPGLYAAGDCTGGFLQVAKAVYEGAVAGSEAVKYIRRKK